MTLQRALPVFSIAFGVLYVVCMMNNFPVFTYVPKARTFHWLVYNPPQNLGPAMFWYGWILTTTIGAAVITAVACLIPQRILARLPAAAIWIVPLALILYVLYVLREYFTH